MIRTARRIIYGLGVVMGSVMAILWSWAAMKAHQEGNVPLETVALIKQAIYTIISLGCLIADDIADLNDKE